MLAVSACLVFFLLLLIPFIRVLLSCVGPGCCPAFIDMEYTRIRDTLAKSFKGYKELCAILMFSILNWRTIALSRREEIQVSPSAQWLAGENITHILCIPEIWVRRKSIFSQRDLCNRDVILGSKNVVKALPLNKTIRLTVIQQCSGGQMQNSLRDTEGMWSRDQYILWWWDQDWREPVNFSVLRDSR